MIKCSVVVFLLFSILSPARKHVGQLIKCGTKLSTWGPLHQPYLWKILVSGTLFKVLFLVLHLKEKRSHM